MSFSFDAITGEFNIHFNFAPITPTNTPPMFDSDSDDEDDEEYAIWNTTLPVTPTNDLPIFDDEQLVQRKSLIIREIFTERYYMDLDMRLYNINTRVYSGIYDEVTGSIDYVDMSNVPDLDIHNCVVVVEDDFFDELALRQENNFNNYWKVV